MRTSRLVSSPAACTRVVLPTHIQCWGMPMRLQVIAGMIRHLLDAYNKPVPAILEIPSKVRRGWDGGGDRWLLVPTALVVMPCARPAACLRYAAAGGKRVCHLACKLPCPPDSCCCRTRRTTLARTVCCSACGLCLESRDAFGRRMSRNTSECWNLMHGVPTLPGACMLQLLPPFCRARCT